MVVVSGVNSLIMDSQTTANDKTYYDPIEYWLNEKTDVPGPGQDIEAMPAHIMHAQAIDTALQPIKDNIRTVLEVGCSYGRITRFMLEHYPAIECYRAIDLSPFKISRALPYIPADKYKDKLSIGVQDFNEMHPVVMTSTNPLPPTYNLVISTQVLMHQLPENVAMWIFKMGALSNHYILNIDWVDTSPRSGTVAPLNFVHNYPEIYKETVYNSELIYEGRMSAITQNIYLVEKRE
jgi:SAM-dependent methyltransferase